ncbi:portal protein [Accumulibacter sp.]|uniref:portal protein n=1 Tax=Accumulibacter sp. TaxID=2053492 RepID=UPI00258930F8|nr:portal protein [Accumulibacter sp.]
MKVHPVDSESDPETAKVRQGMIRYIEYNSNASIAYDTAIGSASETGLGYFRIITEYEREDSFDVVPRFVRIRNPLTVHFDPDSIEGDGSDARRALVEEGAASRILLKISIVRNRQNAQDDRQCCAR